MRWPNGSLLRKPSATLSLLTPLLAVACGGLPAVSSGHVGCAESDIEITDESRGWSTYTWTARCRGRTFYCSTVHGSGESSQTSCKEASSTESAAKNEPATAPLPASAPAASLPVEADGCKYDTQCKGDRVCEKGSCVTPAAPVAAPAPAAPAPAAPAPTVP